MKPGALRNLFLALPCFQPHFVYSEEAAPPSEKGASARTTGCSDCEPRDAAKDIKQATSIAYLPALCRKSSSLRRHEKDSAYLSKSRIIGCGAYSSSSGRFSTRLVGPCGGAASAAAAAQLPIIEHRTTPLAKDSMSERLPELPSPFTDRLLTMRCSVNCLQLLGRGGHSVVLRGVWQLADVAIKLATVHPAATPPATTAKMLREGPLSKRLCAPNVVQTFCYSVARLTVQELAECREADNEDISACASTSSRSSLILSGIYMPIDDSVKLLDFLHEDRQPPQQLLPSHARMTARRCSAPAAAAATGEACDSDEVGSASASALVLPLRSTFESFDGFGSPSLRLSAGASFLRYSDALTAVRAAPGCFLTQIVMELCDRGSLADAVAKGAYAKAAYDRPTMFSYLRTLYDIAAGMSYLHSNGVIHGDLKPGNVLLRSSRVDPRGYMAKVADFGLAACVPPPPRRHTAARGDLDEDEDHSAGCRAAEADWSSYPYMAPEHFDGVLLPASDVWSFGATAHHMWTGALPHAGLHPLQVAAGVCDGGLGLERPTGMPPQLWALLGGGCMAHDWRRRPDFARVRTAIRRLEGEMCEGGGGAL